MKQGTLFYDEKSERYDFHYVDEDGDNSDYGGSIAERFSSSG